MTRNRGKRRRWSRLALLAQTDNIMALTVVKEHSTSFLFDSVTVLLAMTLFV